MDWFSIGVARVEGRQAGAVACGDSRHDMHSTPQHSTAQHAQHITVRHGTARHAS
jgi:hypothetical protein